MYMYMQLSFREFVKILLRFGDARVDGATRLAGVLTAMDRSGQLVLVEAAEGASLTSPMKVVTTPSVGPSLLGSLPHPTSPHLTSPRP